MHYVAPVIRRGFLFDVTIFPSPTWLFHSTSGALWD